MSGLMQRILRRREHARLSPEAPAAGQQGRSETGEARAEGPPAHPATMPAEPPTTVVPAATAARQREASTTLAPAVVPAPARPAEREGQPAAASPGSAAPEAPAPGTEQLDAAPAGAEAPAPAGLPADAPEARSPSFRERARLRRRLRFLRRLRELGFRDLGGLVFDQHRFGRPNDELVRAKLTALAAVDAELRALERALADRRPLTELREPGISACTRCGAVIGSDARFCSSCGTPVGGAQALPGVLGPGS
jgi:hypothetical protein